MCDKVAVQCNGKEIPYARHCAATGVLRISSVYNEGVNFWPKIYIDERKHKEVENHEVILLQELPPFLQYTLQTDISNINTQKNKRHKLKHFKKILKLYKVFTNRHGLCAFTI